MIINFKEISPSHQGDERDDFELFCRDFFSELNYEIDDNPSRGPDGGKDLIVVERRQTELGPKDNRWLISCKHKAQSGKTIGPKDEEDIPGRVLQHHCDGFIGFYSTIATSGLADRILAYSDRFETLIFDHRKIERYIVGDYRMEELFARYFPRSYRGWREHFTSYEPVNLFKKYFEGEYKDFKLLFLATFGTYSSLIKSLREYSDLNSFLAKEGVELVHEPVLEPAALLYIGTLPGSELSFFKDNPEAKTNLEHLIAVVLPYEFRNRSKCDVNSLICTGSLTKDDKDHEGISLGTTWREGHFYLYRNAMLGSNGTFNALDKLCRSLKFMLT